MELRHLRYFVAVAEELHFGRAAKRLGMSQPPLSQQIRNLENDLGVELFRRTKRRVQLRPAGQAFLERAHHLLKGVAQSTEEARRAARGEFGKLEIGYAPMAGLEILPRLVRRFSKRHPRVDIRLQSLRSSQQIDALRSGSIDVGILQLPVKAKPIIIETILREPLLLAMPDGHPLSRRTTVRIRDLAGVPYVHLSRQYAPSYTDLLLGFVAEEGVVLNVVAEAADLYDNLALIASGLGASLLPQTIRRFERAGVVYRPVVQPGPLLETGIARGPEKPSSILKSFLDVARRAYPGR